MPKRATAQESVLKSLRKMLATSRLKPGQQIIQDALAARLGVSRVPVREALKVLQAEGRVIHDPHRGYFVSELNIEDLAEIYHLRALLEDEALKLGVPNASASDVAAIKAIHEEGILASRKGDITQMAFLNRKFHLAIYQLSKQERLITLIENLWDSIDAYRYLFLNDSGNRNRTNEDHARMVQAIKQKDVKAALKIQASHREHAVKAINAQLNSCNENG